MILGTADSRVTRAPASPDVFTPPIFLVGGGSGGDPRSGVRALSICCIGFEYDDDLRGTMALMWPREARSALENRTADGKSVECMWAVKI
jgi:hypothetical protein